MILHFPNLDSLQLALTSGLVPTEVTLAPARVRLENGQAWIEPGAALARGLRSKLRRLGIAVLERKSIALDDRVQCWAQLFSLRKEAGLDIVTPQTPVLFELEDSKQLPELAGEILRLGNDRQSFRGLDDGDETRVYLRVIGPPYYSLLRALEHRPGAPVVQAYVERAPRLWVALGYRHPLLEQLQAPAGKLVLLQPPRHWRYLPEAPFHDIYDIIEFQLPAQPSRCRDVEIQQRLRVPLRLARGSGTEPAELWTLRANAVEQLDALVRTAQDRILSRLRFAVTAGTKPTIILMVVRGKTAPPALDFHGQSYRRHQRMDNLFVPRGLRLEPPLRRDAVRKLLAEDPELITWLVPGDNGSFVPESIPERAFAPLEKWIDYVIERDRTALESWVRSARFDFEPFVCKDETEPKKKEKHRRRERDDLDEEGADLLEASPVPVEAANKPKKRGETRSEETVAPEARATPGELEIKLAELTTQFLEDTRALDHPARQEQWRQLARVMTGLGDRASEAGLCWLHLLWEQYPPEPAALLGWLEAQKSKVQQHAPVIKELNRIALLKGPTDAETHYFAAGVACIGLGNVPDAAALDVARARAFLEEYEGVGVLPIRAIWFAWLGLARLAGGDELALARARDRLLERLYQFGLGPEREVPSFLRFSSHKQSEKFRAVRDRVLKLRDRAQDWLKRQPAAGATHYGSTDKQRTGGYLDLMFSFGLARLGEKIECEKLLEQAHRTLDNVDDVHTLLCEGFDFRIRQALANKAHAGPLPAPLLDQINILRESEAAQKRRPGEDNPLSGMIYAVDRLRQSSAILDPEESFDPYRHHKRYLEAEAELAPLADLRDPAELTARIDKLRASKHKTWQEPGAKVQMYAAILQVAPRLGQDYCVPLLRQTFELLDSLESNAAFRKDSYFLLERLMPLLQHGMNVAAHFGQVPFARQFVGRFLDAFLCLNDTGASKDVEEIVRKSFQALRKLGLREEVERLLNGMAEAILKGESLPQTQARLGNRWIPSLCTLLHLAAAWLYAGRLDTAWPILEAARNVFTDPSIDQHQQDKIKVACAYLSALGQAPVDKALERIEQFFTEIGAIHDAFTCNIYYSLSKLKVVEALVLAVASEDFAVGAEVRRWLDDEEYLVRRRIHADVRGLGHESS